MGIRFDLVYVTKEISRVLAELTKIANELVDRAIEYTIKTKNAHLLPLFPRTNDGLSTSSN